MPSTTEVIDYMEIQANGWNRTGNKGLLEILNQTQDMLYMQNMAQSIAYMPDGSLPILETTDGTRNYTLSQANTGLSVDIWRCESILTKIQFLPDYGLQYQNHNFQSAEVVVYNGIEYFRYFWASSQDALKFGDPELLFSVDVGTTDDMYFMLCYKKATELISESIQLSLPENLHISCLMPAAMKLLEGYQNGNIREAILSIQTEFKPMIQAVMNKAQQGRLNTVQRREY